MQCDYIIPLMPPIGGQSVQYIRTLQIYCNTLLACFTLSLWGQLTDDKMKNKQSRFYDFGEIRSLILGVFSVYNGCEGTIFLTLLRFSQRSGAFSVSSGPFQRALWRTRVFVPVPTSEICLFSVYVWEFFFCCSPFCLIFISWTDFPCSLLLFVSGTLC